MTVKVSTYTGVNHLGVTMKETQLCIELLA